jgi:hypothetical protein
MSEHSPRPATAPSSCQATRLAETSVAAVDVCSCGMLQLHLGALTLRFAPSAADELLETLRVAMARHAAHTGAEESSLGLCGPLGRGQA